MKVIYVTPILERIRVARVQADAANKEIEKIILTPREADELASTALIQRTPGSRITTVYGIRIEVE